MTTLDLHYWDHQEWHCRKCNGDIDAPDITGMLCNECWLEEQEAA